MKRYLSLIFLLLFKGLIMGQTPDSTSVKIKEEAAGDDPSQFFTRIELFNELQHHKSGNNYFDLNQTTFRTIVKVGKRFTTRLDIPYVYNSLSTTADDQKAGLGDISFRLLGYKFLESSKSALTVSMEVSINTAETPLLGLGKNVFIPLFSYTTSIPKRRILLGLIFQEAISFSGDENRDDVSFSKLQPYIIKIWTKKMWTLLAPELYVDYVHGGASMNLEGRFAYAPIKRINIWLQLGTGLFGDFQARYQWGIEVGCRYFFLRNTLIKRKSA
jgi:hypothetical protein